MTITKRGATWRSRAGIAVAVPLTAVALAGCGSLTSTVDEAQKALEAAQSLLDAPQGIATACQTAMAALAPGTSPEEAQGGLRQAVAELDAVLGDSTAIPGIDAVRDALSGALRSATSAVGAAAGNASREAVTTACAVFDLPGMSN